MANCHPRPGHAVLLGGHVVPGDAAGSANGKGTESGGAANVCLTQSLGIALLARLLHSIKKAALPQCHEGVLLSKHILALPFFFSPFLLQKPNLSLWPFSFNVWETSCFVVTVGKKLHRKNVDTVQMAQLRSFQCHCLSTLHQKVSRQDSPGQLVGLCYHRKRLLAVSVSMPRRVETACWVQPKGKGVARHLLCISPFQSIWFLKPWRGWDVAASLAITGGSVMEVKVRMCWSKDPAYLVDGFATPLSGPPGHGRESMLAVGSGRRKLTVASERKALTFDSPIFKYTQQNPSLYNMWSFLCWNQ